MRRRRTTASEIFSQRSMLFQRRFVAWVAKLTVASADVIAIDREMLCGFSHKKGGKAANHRVSALGIHFNAMTAAVRLIRAAKL
jgi:hypothetical protein